METEKKRNSLKDWGMSILTLMLMMLPVFTIDKCKDKNTEFEYTDTTFHFKGYDTHSNYITLDLSFSEIASVVIYHADKTGNVIKLTRNDGTTLTLDVRNNSLKDLRELINVMYKHLTDPRNAPSIQDSRQHTIIIHNDKALLNKNYFDLSIWINKEKNCRTNDKNYPLNVKLGDVITLVYGGRMDPRAFIFRFQDPSMTHYYIDNLTIKCIPQDE